MEIMARMLTGAIKSMVLISVIVIGNNDDQDDNSKTRVIIMK